MRTDPIATSGLPQRDLALPAGGAVFVCACLAAAVGAQVGMAGSTQRALSQIGVGAIIAGGIVEAGEVRTARLAGFWRLVRSGLVLLLGAYAAGALSAAGVGGPWDPVGLALLLGAYPFLFGALCRRAIREEGFESGLATLMDVAILVSSLMVLTIPILVVPLAAQHSSLSLGTGITWASNVGLFAGGLWLLYRLPRGRDVRSTALLVVSLGIFSVLTLVEAALQLRSGPQVAWWFSVLYGPAYALVGLAPRFERDAVDADRERTAGARWLSGRVVMPYIAFVPLLAVWFLSIALGWDARLYGSGIAVVATLVVARQLLLLRDHHHVLVERARQALIDELTQVRNRRAFDEDLAQLADLAQRRDAGLVVLMVDLDELKSINDRSGHFAGDRALVTVAESLSASARTSDRVYRVGGDEFAMLLPDGGPTGAERVLADARLLIADRDGTLSISAGMAALPADARDTETLLRVADGRLYRAKRMRVRPEPPPQPIAELPRVRLIEVAAEQA